MSAKINVRGSQNLQRNINRAIKGTQGNISRGLLAAAIEIAKEAAILTPVDLSFLINSQYTQIIPGELAAEVGYTIDYAPHVHEMPANTNFKKEGAENKFLEKAVNRKAEAIPGIIRKFSR